MKSDRSLLHQPNREVLHVAAIAAMPGQLADLESIAAAVHGRGSLSLLVVPYTSAPRGKKSLPAALQPYEPVTAEPGLAIEPGRIYLVPFDQKLLVRAGRFEMAKRGRRDSTPLKLFSSVAEEYGPKAIGVLLSGTSPDAADALRAIKQHGGAALVQSPTSCRVDEAPRAAIAAGIVGKGHSLPDIAAELAKRTTLERDSESQPTEQAVDLEADLLTDEALRGVLILLKSRFQVDLSMYKLTTIRRRVERRLSLGRFKGMPEYLEHLRGSPEGVQALHDDLFIHVTQFFRDPGAFEALEELVFPQLIKDRSSDDPIRVWVPGCSTGEEAYSLAMALTEYLDAHAPSLKLQLFATDISEGAIQMARKATYAEPLLAPLSHERRERFFERAKDGYRIRKELRQLCVISRHDITTNPPFARIDLISCRNVLIYFGSALQKRVIPLFHYALKPGAFLWLGHSETPAAGSKLFSVVDKQNKVYAKVFVPRPHFDLKSSRFSPEVPLSPPYPVREAAAELDVQSTADQMVLFKYGPPSVVINHDMEVVQFRGRTAPFLEPPTGQPTLSLTKMAHPSLVPVLRPLVQAAKKQCATARKEGVVLEEGSHSRRLNIEVTPLNPTAAERQRHYLVLFELTSASTPAGKRLGNRQRRKGADRPSRGAHGEYAEQLQRELDALREFQQTVQEQFESSQEELTSANEELQATNEELQSTNEELETAKEELQSANEELTTTNDELQARNGELVALNEKLARGEDRFRLMVEGVKDYAIYMLDPTGRVASWNEGARRLKGYEASEILGQHYSRFFQPQDIAEGVPEKELEQARMEGRLETEGYRLRRDGRTFWANVVVTRINDSTGTLIGFSKVTRDLTERRRAAQQLEDSERRFRLMISGVKDYAIFMLDAEGRVASWNEGARRLKGYERDEIVGQHFSVFRTLEDIEQGKVESELETAKTVGHADDEGWRVRKDGSRFWANVAITRLVDEQGNVLGFTKVTRDLTEQKRAEEQLRSANEHLESRVRARTFELEAALKSRDEFLSIASHELKTPLTALKLQLQAARRRARSESIRPLTEEDVPRVFDLALRQAAGLESLVEDLLDVSKVQTGRLTLDLGEVSVPALLRDVATRLAEQAAAVHSHIEVDAGPPTLAYWDSSRIAQVLMNLLSNALKYAPGAAITMSSAATDSSVCMVVEDSGPGINPEKLGSIFERYERAGAPASIGGLGLGLYIARLIVEAHQGTIDVQSDVGHGTRFRVELPRVVPGNTAGG